LSPPEYYRGDRDQFADFIAQLHLVFNSDPQAFRKDQAKISYAGSYMRGAAKRWFNPHINKENGRIAFDLRLNLPPKSRRGVIKRATRKMNPLTWIQALELIWIHRGLVRLRAALLSSPPKFARSIFALREPEFFVHVKRWLHSTHLRWSWYKNGPKEPCTH
jgi:hypothetical protein